MLTRPLFLLASILLVGCASTPPEIVHKPQPVVVLDKDCLMVSKYAKAIAELRIIGVKQEELKSFTASPVVLTFPILLIQNDVYANKTLSPIELLEKHYNICVQVGYTNVYDRLANDEQVRLAREIEEGRKKAREEQSPQPVPAQSKPTTQKPAKKK